jgi:O-antigen/teichoic acid export membrane protein
VAIPLALLGFGVWALVAQTVIGALCATIALWASTSWRPSLEFSWASLRGLWSVGGAILGIDLLDAIQANIDKLVVGAFFDPTTLGYYFLAQRVGTILIELVTSVMSRVSLTTFSRVQDDRQRVDRIFRQLTFAASAVSVPVFGLVAVFAEQIVNGVFGPGWEQAVPILWILAPGWALGAVMYFDRNVLIATEHTRAALILAVVQNAVSIVLVFVFIPFGVLGVAFSRLARFVTWPARLVVLHRLAGIAIGKYLLQIGRAIAAMSPFIVVCALLQLTPWASSDHALWTFALPLAGLSLVGYAGVLWLIAGTESRALIARVITDVRRRGRAAE